MKIDVTKIPRDEVKLYECYFNGAKLLGVLSADEEAGEIIMVDLEDGKLILDSTSPFKVRTKTYKGRVKVYKKEPFDVDSIRQAASEQLEKLEDNSNK